MRHDIEQSIIGCILCEPDLLAEASSHISPDDFANEQAARIYQACLDLEEGGKAYDAVLAVAQAGKDCQGYAVAAMAYPSIIDNFELYLEAAIEDIRRTKAIALCKDLQGELMFGDLQNAQATAASLADGLTQSTDDDTLDIIQGRKSFLVRQSEPVSYISTGYSKLDKGMYIEGGDYIIIGGRPSSGKTAFALNLAANIAKTRNVVFFSLETKNDKIMDRLMTAIYGFDFSAVKRHSLPLEVRRRLLDERELSDKLRFKVVMAAGKPVSWIQAKARKLKADVIFIDYMGLLPGKGSRYEIVTEASISLHVMAQRTGMAVFTLCQLNRGDDTPSMSSLRESGQIEQDADIIAFLHKGEDPARRELIVAKNKEGVTASIELAFVGAKQQFCELSEYTEVPGKWPGKR